MHVFSQRPQEHWGPVRFLSFANRHSHRQDSPGEMTAEGEDRGVLLLASFCRE
jgi:hypothetical protein